RLRELLHVLRRGALLALHDLELHLVALGEGLVAAPLDSAVVDETVLQAVLRRDKAEALGVVEPFHGAGGTHVVLLLVMWCSSESVDAVPTDLCSPHQPRKKGPDSSQVPSKKSLV